jgi:CRISPR-associated exonuclease Cas4
MFSEEALIPVSALQHMLYCERQCALIHIEQVWAENRFTTEGVILHKRVDIVHHEHRRGFRTEYGMALRSLEHGLIGKADVVEFIKDGKLGYQEIAPVEFKRGKKKVIAADRVQLCAQAFCLEEMFNIPIPKGQIYYLQDHRRTSIVLDEELRDLTVQTIQRTRKLIDSGTTPVAEYERRKCDRCSLLDLCMPRSVGANRRSVDTYLEKEIRMNLRDTER